MIGQSISKIDGMAAIMGKALYVEDLKPDNCLILKILRSPYPHAKIAHIDLEKARKISGVACILTYKDVPQKPMTFAAEASPEGSPHDRTILERIVRFVGEPVAVVAAENEEIARAAIEQIAVDYEVLKPNLDYETAIDNKNPLFTEEEIFNHWDTWDNGNNVSRNICAAKFRDYGDIGKSIKESPHVVEGLFYTQAQAHGMLETHRAFCYQDMRGKLIIYSSTQSVFHVQRLVTEGLGLSPNKVRVIKPKVGGAFGGKNTLFLEGLVAAVTLKTGRPSILVLDRKECFTSTNTRHASTVRARIGADQKGFIRAIDLQMLTNAGAHGEHSFDVLNVACNNTLPIYGKIDAVRFEGQAAYTNMVPAGAYRGFGGPQSTFALEGVVSDLAYKLDMDPTEVRLRNIIREGEEHPFVAGYRINSSTLEQLIMKGKEKIGWTQKYPCKRVAKDIVRAVGMSIAMHGSGIWGLDSVNATISFNYNGCFTLSVGSCDLGTGADTILLQIAAKALRTSIERINLNVSDSDLTPYDKGAYASSTTYVTGNAVKLACENLLEKMKAAAAQIYAKPAENFIFQEDWISLQNDNFQVSIFEFAETICRFQGTTQLISTAGWKCPISPPPYVAGFVEMDVDTQTGKVTLLNYVAMIDCGTVINPNLARVQAEGGLVQCMGYTLLEDVKYTEQGKLLTDNFLKYRMPTTLDLPKIEVDFVESYEPTGPFGAKSIGEVVFHTPAAAIREALLHATGIGFNSLPITPEKILMGIEEQIRNGGKLPC